MNDMDSVHGSFEDNFDRQMDMLEEVGSGSAQDCDHGSWLDGYASNGVQERRNGSLIPGIDNAVIPEINSVVVPEENSLVLTEANGEVAPETNCAVIPETNGVVIQEPFHSTYRNARGVKTDSWSRTEANYSACNEDDSSEDEKQYTMRIDTDLAGKSKMSEFEFSDEILYTYKRKSVCCPCCRSRAVVSSSKQEPINVSSTNMSQAKKRRKMKLEQRKKDFVKCCKQFIAFLFSHIGLCSLVVAYTTMGGFVFMALEAPAEIHERHVVAVKRRVQVDKLWNITLSSNVFSKGNWSWEVDLVLKAFQAEIYQATKESGWDGKDGTEDIQWSFAGSLLYSITVITTIGYGHIAPKTDSGRFVTIIYALFGIPLTFLCIANLGTLLESCFRIFYKHTCLLIIKLCCPSQAKWSSVKNKTQSEMEALPMTSVKADAVDDVDNDVDKNIKRDVRVRVSTKEEVRVPMLVSLMLIVLYILAGAVLFSQWEKGWALLDGAYFCFITLTTIGFGDLVPGTGDASQKEKLVICSFYLFFGLAIIAMCFNLMQDEVRKKFKWLGKKMGIID